MFPMRLHPSSVHSTEPDNGCFLHYRVLLHVQKMDKVSYIHTYFICYVGQ